MARITGVWVLLSIVTEYMAIGLGSAHGGFDAIDPASFGSGERLTQLAQSHWFVWILVLAILAPGFAMIAWVGMYEVLEPGGATAFPGVVVSALAMLFGVVAECIRLAMVLTLPSAYLGSTDAARPAILALGAVLGNAFRILDSLNFIVLFAVGTPLIAIAIVRGRQLPAWLGWSLLIPTILVGYIGAPLVLLGRSIGDGFMGVGMNLFFLSFAVMGVLLLRWRPRAIAQ